MSAQLPLAVRLRDSASFENFYPAENAEALQHVTLLAQAPAETCQLLYLWGVAATGKSHLLHAACHVAQQHGQTPVYIPLAEAAALAPAMLQDLVATELVCLDDLEAIGGQRAWEEAVMALYEQRRQHGGKLLIAAARKPAQLGLGLADLRTRLEAGLVYGLRQLQDQDKLAALRWRAQRRGLVLGDEVTHYIINHCSRDTAQLFALLERLDQASLIEQRAITIPFLKRLLAER